MDPEWCVGVRWDKRWFKIIKKLQKMKADTIHWTMGWDDTGSEIVHN